MLAPVAPARAAAHPAAPWAPRSLGTALRRARSRSRHPAELAAVAMALTSQMQTLRIDYDPALVPAGGAEVTRACASP